MTYKELLSSLKTIGYPVAYDTFKERQSPPFITILYTNNNDLIADNINYLNVSNFQIELYTIDYNPPAEREVENQLKEIGLAYDKLQTKMPDENLYQTVYDIQLIGG